MDLRLLLVAGRGEIHGRVRGPDVSEVVERRRAAIVVVHP